MSAAWDISDFYLGLMLTSIQNVTWIGKTFGIHLYKNDYTPVPGSDESDYDQCDFPGYGRVSYSMDDMGSVSVVDHVAISTGSTTAIFTADSSGFTSQDVYGYYVIDEDDNYVWGERFASMRVVHPNDVIQLTPEFRERTYPYT